MDAPEILKLWMTIHSPLDVRQQKVFLDRPELDSLVRLPDGSVRSAVSRSPRLVEIARTAVQGAWWFSGNPCPEDDLTFCGRCKPHPYPSVVVMSRGWSSAFHQSANCHALRTGQDTVLDRGGEMAPVERVAVQIALSEGKHPCSACFPP